MEKKMEEREEVEEREERIPDCDLCELPCGAPEHPSEYEKPCWNNYLRCTQCYNAAHEDYFDCYIHEVCAGCTTYVDGKPVCLECKK